jgi:Na+-driven multidrug efflux pump
MSIYDIVKTPYGNYNVHNDISLVDAESEARSNITNMKNIMISCFSNILPFLILCIIDSINLICLGRKGEDIVNFQIAVIYLNLLCLIFALGMINSYDFENFEGEKFFKMYLIAKDHIFFIVFTLVIPVSLLSYYILFEIFTEIWNIYNSFLIYAPIIVILKLFINLNMRVLKYSNNNILLIACCYVFLHFVFSYYFIFFFELGVFGSTLAMIISSLLTCLISFFYISKLFNLFNFSYLTIFTVDLGKSYDILLSSVFKGFFCYLEYAGYGLLILASYYLGEDVFKVNLILFNIVTVPHIVCQGCGITIKHYLIQVKSSKVSFESRKRFICCFLFVTFIIGVLFAVSLLTFRENILKIFLLNPSNKMIFEFNTILNLYSAFLIFDFLSIILDGFISGLECESDYLKIYKAFVFMIIFCPLGIFITYLLNMQLLGIWATIFLFSVIHSVVGLIYVYKVHGLYAFKE